MHREAMYYSTNKHAINIHASNTIQTPKIVTSSQSVFSLSLVGAYMLGLLTARDAPQSVPDDLMRY